jgi:hypothetical protein
MVMLWESTFIARVCATRSMGASSNKDKPERLVIAYQDEDRLRDLIAAPSILGLDFPSREEAMGNLEGLTHSERLI